MFLAQRIQLGLLGLVTLPGLALADPPAGAVLLKAPSGTNFLYVGGEHAMDKMEAIAACRVLGAHLADLRINDDYTFLSHKIEGAAWINSFDGKSLGPFALYSGGAIRAFRESHEDLKGAICQMHI